MIVMNLLKIENICYSETFFMRKNTFFIHFVIVILIFKALNSKKGLLKSILFVLTSSTVN
jgi:hypothetical protein